MPDDTYRAGDIPAVVGEHHACGSGCTGAIAHGTGPLAGYIERLVVDAPATAAAAGVKQRGSQHQRE